MSRLQLRIPTLAASFSTAAVLPALLVVVLCSLALATPASAADPPNVVLIISDDQAWTDYSFMDHKVIETPRLDRLARESATFTRGYVPGSLCRPSLMAMITGLYPHQNGITGNDPPKGTDRNLMLKHVKAAECLPELLAKKGYVSLQTGKWWEGAPKLAGFTSAMTHGDTSRGGRHGDLGLKIGREGMQPIYDFIDGRGDKPFFLWYAPFLPHTPHTPPERLLKKYLQKVDSPHMARYYAMCEWFDETCGQLLDYLDKKKLSDNTLVLYVADNGWIQQPNARGYAPRSKRSQYDGGVRTPIMVRWPGKIKPMMDKNTLVSSVDLAPTILAACGIEPDENLPGINLLPVCQGESSPRDTIYGEIFAHDVADIDDPSASLQYRWCIAGDWKLIVPRKGNQVELYNLKEDPYEKNNLAAEKPDLVARLKKKLNAWWSPKP
jgi:arylsulfatase A-like enzyme